MKIIKILSITCLLWFCPTFSVHAQYTPTVNHTVSDDGQVSYEHVDAGARTFVFTLFGDGTFSTRKNPIHYFQPRVDDYPTETYFARPYDPNFPPKVITNVSTINSAVNPSTGIFSNPPINMTGNIDLMTSWATAQNYENFYIIAFTNTSSATPVDGCIEFYYNESDIDINFSDIKTYNFVFDQTTISPTNTQYTHKIRWQFTGLNLNERRYVYVPAVTKTPLGKEHSLDVKFGTDCGAMGLSNEHRFLSRKYPHDPNFKIANKDCVKLQLNDQQELIYTIGFFNDGEYFARNVYVEDHLPSTLDTSKITFLGSEYPVTWSEKNGIVNFDFLNINLPGTNQVVPRTYSYDDAATHFTFKICTKGNLTESVLNRASILFDSQEIYFTNTSKVSVEQDCMDYAICGENSSARNQVATTTKFTEDADESEFTFTAFPNPANDVLHVNINAAAISNASIVLRDFSGRIIKSLTIQEEKGSNLTKTISLKGMASGMYFLTLNTKETTYTKKIIKN
ncbi:MAG: T9SS type A sorting domain-containing protein [Bacteroidota bacterium]